MKIYRGPESKPLADPAHSVVDSVNISPKGEKWVGQKLFRVSISKDGYLNPSVATIVLNPDDVVGLMNGLLIGWQGELNDSEHLLREISRLKDSLNFLYDYTKLKGCNNVRGRKY